MSSEQGEAGKKAGLTESVIDTRDYQPNRYKVVYTSPQGEEVTEELIMFVKLSPDGQPQFVTAENGQALAFNADLYDSRLSSHKHAQGVDYGVTVLPKIDGRGAYTGVMSLIEGKAKPEQKQPVMARQPAAIAAEPVLT
jgi:hypothetical protein